MTLLLKSMSTYYPFGILKLVLKESYDRDDE